jgi:hypothetical protein
MSIYKLYLHILFIYSIYMYVHYEDIWYHVRKFLYAGFIFIVTVYDV